MTKRRTPHTPAWIAVAVALIAALNLVCQGTVLEEPICVPGETVQCQCPDGRTGAKACKSDGSGWECCVCTGPCPEWDDDDAGPHVGDDDDFVLDDDDWDDDDADDDWDDDDYVGDDDREDGP